MSVIDYHKKVDELESLLREKEDEINELQLKNHELKQQAEYLDRIIASMPGYVYWKNSDGSFQGCNQNTADLLSLNSRQEIIGKTIDQVWPKDFAQEICKRDEVTLKDDTEITFEQCGLNKDGNSAVYLTHKIPFRDKNNNIIGTIGVSFDISERKKIKSELYQAKENLEKMNQEQLGIIQKLQNFEHLLSILPGNVYWKNRAGQYLGCNKNMADILGLNTPEDIKDKTIFDLVEPKIARIIHETDEHIMGNNEAVFVEEKGNDINGNYAIYLTKKIPLHNEKDEVNGLLGLSFDITERKKLEEELEKTKEALEKANHNQEVYIEKMQYLEDLIAILPGNVYWKDRQGRYLGCNENVVKLSKFNSYEDLQGKTIFDLADPKTAELIHEQDERIMLLDKPFTVEEQGYDAEGKRAHYLTKKTPIRDEQGKVIGLLGISIDITERKELEENLRLAKQRAEEANQMKITFIKNMEHDIRTPFCGVYGLSKFLLENETDFDKKEILTDIVQSVEELLEYCNSILDFAKAEFNGPVANKQFNLRELVTNLLAMQRPAAKAKGIVLMVDLPANLPRTIKGDEYRLQRILINLMSNAIKFTEEGYVKIQIIVEECNNSGILLKFCIEDTGIGIAPGQQEMIYGLFNRLSPSNQGMYKGLGLGLTLVKRFLEEMSGQIEVISELGRGSTFILRIPFQLT